MMRSQLAIAAGGALRDSVSALATRGTLGTGLSTPAVGYGFVYILEIGLLFMTLVVIGPLVRVSRRAPQTLSGVQPFTDPASLHIAGNAN